MNVFVVIFFAVLVVLFLPVTLRGSVSFDALSNSGRVLAKLYKVTVYDARLSVCKQGIALDGKKRYVISFASFTGKGDFKTRFFKNLFVYIRYNDVRSIGCIGGDSMGSCIACGLLDILSGGALALATGRLNVKNYQYSFLPSFFSPEASIYISGSVTFNLALLIYCLVCSLVQR